MPLLCLSPWVPKVSPVTLLPSPASGLSCRDPAKGAPLSATALPPTSQEHQQGFGSQGGHSILSPPHTGECVPRLAKTPNSIACSKAEPTKASQ